MSYIAKDIKANLLKAIELLEKIESGEKSETLLSQVDVNLKLNIDLIKSAGFASQAKKGRPKSDNPMTGAERVRKHRQNAAG